MTLARLRHLHLILLPGIALFVPLFLSYSLCVDLSEIMLLSSDMNLEDPRGEDLSTCQNEVGVFVPTISSAPVLPVTRFDTGPILLSSALAPHMENMSILRC